MQFSLELLVFLSDTLRKFLSDALREVEEWKSPVHRPAKKLVGR